jgi:hypothetical protein
MAVARCAGEGEGATMTGFAVEGDLALNEDETDVILVAGARAVEQQVRVGSLNWKGFQTYDDDGLPMTTDILGKGKDLSVVTQLFREWLASIDGVVSVKKCDVSLDRETRALSVLYAVECEDGETLSSEVSFSVG